MAEQKESGGRSRTAGWLRLRDREREMGRLRSAVAMMKDQHGEANQWLEYWDIWLGVFHT